MSPPALWFERNRHDETPLAPGFRAPLVKCGDGCLIEGGVAGRANCLNRNSPPIGVEQNAEAARRLPGTPAVVLRLMDNVVRARKPALILSEGYSMVSMFAVGVADDDGVVRRDAAIKFCQLAVMFGETCDRSVAAVAAGLIAHELLPARNVTTPMSSPR